jgi:hypothetical protein
MRCSRPATSLGRRPGARPTDRGDDGRRALGPATVGRTPAAHMGITFNLYGEDAGTERIFPFDLVPRIVAAAEWKPSSSASSSGSAR